MSTPLRGIMVRVPRFIELDVKPDAEEAPRAPRLVLLPERAVWVPAARLLLVADLHLGKASSFRRHGLPVPEGTTQDNLVRLEALIAARRPQTVAFLGDFLHAREAHAPAVLAALSTWRQRQAEIDLIVVRGNHDRHAGDPPAWLGARCVDEPHAVEGAPDLLLCHHPQRLGAGLVLAGHLHPCTFVARGFERLRLPCFHLQEGCLTVPAFGAFTGMHPVERREGDRVFAVADERIVELPP